MLNAVRDGQGGGGGREEEEEGRREALFLGRSSVSREKGVLQDRQEVMKPVPDSEVRTV